MTIKKVKIMLEILLGQIPEALYFATFIILVKQLKEKRISYILLMTVEYIILLQFFKFSVYCQITYTVFTYIILKILYKEKTQITDVFTFGMASIILIIISAITSLIFKHSIVVTIVISRLLMILFLFLFRNKLPNIQKLYKRLWNRNDKIRKRMKSTTFRVINTVVFNLMFYIINVGMLYALLFKK